METYNRNATEHARLGSAVCGMDAKEMSRWVERLQTEYGDKLHNNRYQSVFRSFGMDGGDMLIGGLGSFLFGKRWYLLPAGVFLLTPLFAAVFELFENGWKTAVDQLPATLIFALIYALLVLAGIAIAALFRFAFRKEEKQ